jgi:hypothetical protein
MEAHELVLTKERLITQAKKSAPLFRGESLPCVKIRFDEFGVYAGLFTEDQLGHNIDGTLSKSWKAWTHDRDYDAKKNIFRKLGFDVVGLFVRSDKFIEFSHEHHWNRYFITQQKDLFAVSVTNNTDAYQEFNQNKHHQSYLQRLIDNRGTYQEYKNVIFVLQYRAENRGEIARATVDYVKIANRRQHQLTRFNSSKHPAQTE